MDLKQKPRLLAVAKQIGIEAHIFVITARGSKAGPANPDELAGGPIEGEQEMASAIALRMPIALPIRLLDAF
jgi:hypothetical protein